MKKRIITLALVLGLSVAMIGCAKDGNNSSSSENIIENQGSSATNNDRVVVTFQNHDITVDELYTRFVVYAHNNSVTSDNMNDVNIEYVLVDIIKQAQIEIAEYNKAIEAGITLDDATKEKAKNQADAFVTFLGPAFLDKYEMNKETIYDIFEMESVVSLYMNNIYQDKLTELIPKYKEDYADYEFEKVLYAQFSILDVDAEGNVSIDPLGNYAVVDDDKKAEIYARAEEFLSELKEDSSNMEDLIAKYGILESSGVDYLYKGEADDELSNAVRGLGVGEHTGIVNTSTGYIIVRVDNTNDLDIKDKMLEYYASNEAKEYINTFQEDIKAEIYLDMEKAGEDIKAELKLMDILKTLESNDFGY